MTEPSNQPIRRISGWKVLGLFCLVSFLILLGIVFIPWDIKPIDDPDLRVQIPAIAPEENAFTWFEKADRAQVMNFVNHSDGSERDWNYLAGSIEKESGKWDPVFVAEVLSANAAVFSDLARGLACRQYAVPKAQSVDEPSPYYLSLARLLRLKSKQAQLAGELRGAIKPALQLFCLGQMITAGSNDRFEWLGGIACETMALMRLEELIADARTPDSARQEIQSVIDQWSPEGIVNGYRNAMRGDYIVMSQRIKNLLNGKNPEIPKNVWMIPYRFKPNMTNRDLAAAYRHRLASASLSSSRITSDYPGKPKLPTSGMAKMIFEVTPNSVGKQLVLVLMEFDTTLNKKFSLQAFLGALRLKIALLQYEKKYGQLPENLTALVPEFMPMVPKDPFDDQPFRYSKEKKQVWSIGEDGVDDGGVAENGRIMASGKFGFDAVMPLGTREMKPNLAPPPANKED